MILKSMSTARELNPKELLSFTYWREKHRQQVERHSKIESRPNKSRLGQNLTKPWK